MNTDIIINNIIRLPEKFYSLGNMSMYSLLKETGYFEAPKSVNETNILDVLVKHPEYINQWLRWSEDKRSSSGWHFKQDENGKYVVGYFPAKEEFTRTEYSDVTKACSLFIMREIEDIRRS